MPYTTTADERGQIDAIRTGLGTMKHQLQDLIAIVNTAQIKANTLVTSQRAAGKAALDANDANAAANAAERARAEAMAYAARADLERIEGLARQLRGDVMAAHARMSRDLCAAFTDGAGIVLAGPGR